MNAVRRLDYSSTMMELRSLLGLCNVFRRFMLNFAQIASCLNKKLQKVQSQNFEGLTEDKIAALETLKARIVEPPVLHLPRSQSTYTVDTDAHDKQIACLLLQKKLNGTDKPVGYRSRLLNDVERAYGTAHRECLEVVWAVFLLRPYLEGFRLTVCTEHDVLKWILNLTDWTGKPARQRLYLSKFEVDVVHCAGIKHQAANVSSQIKTTGTDQTPIEDKIPVFYITASIPRKRRGESYVYARLRY